MKIIVFIALCFFFFCMVSKKFVVKINNVETDSLLVRTCVALLVAAIVFLFLTGFYSTLLLILSLAR